MGESHLVCLVDFYNVRPRFSTANDCSACLDRVVEELFSNLLPRYPGLTNLQIRLYGGWRGMNGRPTRDAGWLLGSVARLRGRRDGVLVSAKLATSLVVAPEHEMVGTLRKSKSAKAGQKMVDTMMTADAAHLARIPGLHVALWSDDDDLLPAVLSTRPFAEGQLVWFRKRARGIAVNDEQLHADVTVVAINTSEDVL